MEKKSVILLFDLCTNPDGTLVAVVVQRQVPEDTIIVFFLP